MRIQRSITEYDRDYRIGIGSSEVVQQSTRMEFSQLSVGNSHGELVTEEELEVSL
jgi:hypothetical protein